MRQFWSNTIDKRSSAQQRSSKLGQRRTILLAETDQPAFMLCFFKELQLAHGARGTGVILAT
jgi:hypothetical protein